MHASSLAPLVRRFLPPVLLALLAAAGCGPNGATLEDFNPPPRSRGDAGAVEALDSGAADADKDASTGEGQDAAPPGEPVITAKPLVDLYAFQMWGAASGKCEVSILSGASNYMTFTRKAQGTLNATPPNGSIEMMTGDIDGDGKTDLYFLGRVETNSGGTEIHVMDGAMDYGRFLLAVRTGFDYTGTDRMWSFRVGDFNGDKKPDLYGITSRSTGTNTTEVHVVDGANNLMSFLEHTGSALPVYDEAHTPFFALADMNKDGKPDLYAISGYETASGSPEVTVLDGANHFQTVLDKSTTTLKAFPADGRTSATIGDADGDGNPDLFIIHRAGTSSGMTEVTIVSGADKFKTVLRRGPTGLATTQTDAKAGWYFDLAPP